MFELSFSYSPWFLLLCALGAGGLAWWMYRRLDVELALWLKRTLAGLRFLVLFILLMLFLEPLWTAITEERRPPIVAILQDNSQSLMATQDSAYLKDEHPQALSKLRQRLEDEGIAVQTYRFDQQAQRIDSPDSVRYDGTGTNLARSLKQVNESFANQNLAAYVLLSDGIPTEGRNPVNTLDNINVPIYTGLLGDTTERKDLLVESVLYNDLSYVDTETPIKATIRGNGISPQRRKVTLRRGEELIATQSVRLTQSNDFSSEVEFYVQLKEPGVREFTLRVEGIEGEQNYDNNARTFFIKVLENKLKIALLAGAPHPDIGALRKAFGRQKRYTLDAFIRKDANSFYQDPAQANLKDYDLFVLHNFPSEANDRPVLKDVLAQVEERKAALMHIVGPGTKFNILPELKDHMALQPKVNTSSSSEAFLYLTPGYRNHASYRFDASQAEFSNWLENAPPLSRLDAKWHKGPGGQVYGKAKIKGIAMNYPMFGLGEQNGRKNMVLTGTGIWRYRVNAYKERESFAFFDTWFQNLAQWLTVRADKRRFKVYPTEDLFTGQEPVIFKGQAYDETYEPLSGAEIQLNVEDPEGKELDYYLQEVQKGTYQAKLRNLSEGTYSYKATGTKNGQQIGTDRGRFSVGRSAAEFIELQANAQGLRQMALRTDGAYHAGHAIDSLAQAVLNQENLPVRVDRRRTTLGLHRVLWPLLIVFLLLTAEWFLRKRHGLL